MQLAYQIWPKSADASTQNAPHSRDKITLLHGMGGTGSLWRPIAATLEDHFDLFSPDQRGHGASRNVPNPDFSAVAYGQDLVETWKTIGFEPSWVIGHSMGVRTACAAAHLSPDSIQGLILIDLGLYGPVGGGLGDPLASFLKNLPHQFESRTLARTFLQAHCPDPAIAQYLLAVTVPYKTPSGENGVEFPFENSSLIRTIETARDLDLRPWLKKLASQNTPVLFLKGQTSPVWSAEDFRAAQEEFSPYTSFKFLEFKNTGHGLPFEQRALFCETVKDWIKQNRPKQRD